MPLPVSTGIQGLAWINFAETFKLVLTSLVKFNIWLELRIIWDLVLLVSFFVSDLLDIKYKNFMRQQPQLRIIVWKRNYIYIFVTKDIIFVQLSPKG